MSYQPYPSGGGVGNQMPMTVQPPQPPSLRNAVRLMWVGAGLALLGTILTLTVSSKIKTAVTNAAIKNNAIAHSQGKAVLTLAQIHTLANITAGIFVAAGVISVLLWVWMAWANNRGSGWARIVGSVLFALITIEVLPSLRRASVSIVFILLEWLLGLAVVVLLWRKDSSEYFAQSRLR